MCIAHGSNAKPCKVPGCKKFAVKRSLCAKHGAQEKVHYLPFLLLAVWVSVIHTSVTWLHSAPPVQQTRTLCRADGCRRYPIGGEYCQAHASQSSTGTRVDTPAEMEAPLELSLVSTDQPLPTCSVRGCKRAASLQNGVCRVHSGKSRICTMPECNNVVVKGGLCKAHGANVYPPSFRPSISPGPSTLHFFLPSFLPSAGFC